jgi:hypothetical protein
MAKLNDKDITDKELAKTSTNDFLDINTNILSNDKHTQKVTNDGKLITKSNEPKYSIRYEYDRTNGLIFILYKNNKLYFKDLYIRATNREFNDFKTKSEECNIILNNISNDKLGIKSKESGYNIFDINIDEIEFTYNHYDFFIPGTSCLDEIPLELIQDEINYRFKIVKLIINHLNKKVSTEINL